MNRDLQHEHEWHIDRREPCEYFETDLLVYEKCQWVEITGSVTSERHDEVFYETGAECAATRTTVFEVEIPVLEEGVVGSDHPLVREIDDEVRRRLEANGTHAEVLDWYDHRDGVDTGDHEMWVEADGGHYEVRFEHDKTTVREDWK